MNDIPSSMPHQSLINLKNSKQLLIRKNIKHITKKTLKLPVLQVQNDCSEYQKQLAKKSRIKKKLVNHFSAEKPQKLEQSHLNKGSAKNIMSSQQVAKIKTRFNIIEQKQITLNQLIYKKEVQNVLKYQQIAKANRMTKSTEFDQNKINIINLRLTINQSLQKCNKFMRQFRQTKFVKWSSFCTAIPSTLNKKIPDKSQTIDKNKRRKFRKNIGSRSLESKIGISNDVRGWESNIDRIRKTDDDNGELDSIIFQ